MAVKRKTGKQYRTLNGRVGNIIRVFYKGIGQKVKKPDYLI